MDSRDNDGINKESFYRNNGLSNYEELDSSKLHFLGIGTVMEDGTTKNTNTHNMPNFKKDLLPPINGSTDKKSYVKLDRETDF